MYPFASKVVAAVIIILSSVSISAGIPISECMVSHLCLHRVLAKGLSIQIGLYMTFILPCSLKEWGYFFLYVFKFVLNSKAVLSASESECLGNGNVGKIYPAEVLFFPSFLSNSPCFHCNCDRSICYWNTHKYKCTFLYFYQTYFYKHQQRKKACWWKAISQIFQTILKKLREIVWTY